MLPEIFIQPALKALVPNLALGCVAACVSVEKHSEALWREIDQRLAHLAATIKPEQPNTLPQIAAMRGAYKALGKDPSRYRGSAEALLRRVLSGKGLYQINSVVDINNLVSLSRCIPPAPTIWRRSRRRSNCASGPRAKATKESART